MLAQGIHCISFDDELIVYWNRVKSLQKNEKYIVKINGEEVGCTVKTHFETKSVLPQTEYCVEVWLSTEEGLVLIGEEKVLTPCKPKRLDVTKEPYHAVGDGKTLNTAALQRALDDCQKGECVYFPVGTYLTGGLKVHSDTQLYVEKGAVIQGSNAPKDYLPLIKSRSEGLSMYCYQSLLNVGDLDEREIFTCQNVTIRGGGAIVSGGNALMEAMEKEALLLLKDYIDGLGDRIKEFDRGELTIAGRLRGRLLNISNSQNVILSNVYLGEGPYWNVHFIYSDKIITHGCTIYTRGIHNGDGWNPDSCTNCVCFDVDFDCGDNCVAIKSGRNPDGNRIARPTKNVNIFDCRVLGGGGFAIGSEISGGVEDVTMWDLNAENGSLGIQIKTTSKRGGYIKKVRVYDSVLPSVNVNASYMCNADGESAGYLTRVEDLSFENNLLTGEGKAIIYGDENRDVVKAVEMPIIRVIGFDNDKENFKDIRFKNCFVKKKETEFARQKIEVDNLNGLCIDGLKTIE